MDLSSAIELIKNQIADLIELALAPIDIGGKGPDVKLDAADLNEQLISHRSGLFIGCYDEEFATLRLEEGGVLPRVRERVGADVRVRVPPGEDLLRIYRADRPEGEDALLIEIKARVEHVPPPRILAMGVPPGDVLVLDWMLMQNPGQPFAPGRRALPGQKHPGLAVGPRLVETAIRRGALRVGAIAVVGIPMYFHTAVLYHRSFAFVDPVDEGRFQALARDLKHLSFEDAAWAVHEGRVRDATFDKPYRWCGTEMMIPLSDSTREYLSRPRYVDAAARTLIGTRFEVVAR